MISKAQEAQHELNGEVDELAAKLIREEGIPLYDAIAQAQQIIRKKRSRYPGWK